MASLREQLETRGDVRNPRALARHIGKKRHGRHSLRRAKARARGFMRA